MLAHSHNNGVVNGHSLSIELTQLLMEWIMKNLSKAEIAIIKARILRGDQYVEIASDYRINQGRIADLKFGRLYPEIRPAYLSWFHRGGVLSPHSPRPSSQITGIAELR